MSAGDGARRRRRRRRQRRSLLVLLIVLVGAFFVLRPTGTHSFIHRSSAPSPADIAHIDIPKAAAISPLRGRIVAIAVSQVGYRTDPANTYYNKYSAYWISGANNCGNGNLDEEWCADFAAWVWQKAGALVTYQYINGDLSSSSASFYEWGSRRERGTLSVPDTRHNPGTSRSTGSMPPRSSHNTTPS